MTNLERHFSGQVELLGQSDIMEQTSTEPSLFVNHIFRECSLDNAQSKVEDSIRVIELSGVEMGLGEFGNSFGELGCRWR